MDSPFKSGFVSCQAAMTRSLTTLLDETFKSFRTVGTATKVKALHAVAEVAHDHAKKNQFTDSEQLQLGLLLKMISEIPDQEIKPFATELLFIALKLTVNSKQPKIASFATRWERFLKRVMSFETPGYAAHRAAVFGTLAILEIEKFRREQEPELALQRAFNYVTDGWTEDYQIILHPTMVVIEAALSAKVPAGAKLPLDLAMAGLVALVEKSLIERRRTLDQERFTHSYLWLVSQVEVVSRSPGLAHFPKLNRKMIELKGSIGAPNSQLPN
jgi:hypothetical protein